MNMYIKLREYQEIIKNSPVSIGDKIIYSIQHNTYYSYHLSMDKVYSILKIGVNRHKDILVYITNDKGDRISLTLDSFILLKDLREDKLNKLNIL